MFGQDHPLSDPSCQGQEPGWLGPTARDQTQAKCKPGGPSSKGGNVEYMVDVTGNLQNVFREVARIQFMGEFAPAG